MSNENDRKLAVDRTPIPVAEQILRALMLDLGKRARILDVGCGEGAWGVAARRVWPHAEISGIDIRTVDPSDAYNIVFVGDFREYRSVEYYDLVIGNPPFSCFLSSGKRHNLFPDLLKFAFDVLANPGTICFYGLNDLGQRGATTRDMFDVYCPIGQMRVAGSVSHRGPKDPEIDGSGATDRRCYSAWVWDLGRPRKSGEERSWQTIDLPLLDAKDRRWVTIPGSLDEA